MTHRFGLHELDEQRFQLRRSGVRIQVRPKVFDLLVHLVRHRHRVVLRDELIMALWGTTAVGLGSLSGLVNELRQILGEAGRGPSSIRTVHARGYQFVAEIEAMEPDSSPPTQGRSDRTGMGITQRTISADPGRFKIALGRVRAAFASVPTAGARAAVVAGASEADRSCLLEQASVELSEAGFEIHRFGETTRLEETSSSLVDRLIDTLIERYGVEAIRSAIPIRARELRARVGSQRPISNPQRQNPLAARQYDEQLWRSTADLLAELAKRRALALVVDGGEQAATVPIRVVLPLLRLLDSAAVFILCSVRSDGSAQPERDEMFDPRIDFVQLAPVLDRRRMNELLVSRGVAALPVVLADALLSHVRADETALETITAWLQMERERGEHNPDRRMKRVRPDTESRHSKLGVA